MDTFRLNVNVAQRWRPTGGKKKMKINSDLRQKQKLEYNLQKCEKDVRLTLFHRGSDKLQFSLFNSHRRASSFLYFNSASFFFLSISQNSFPQGYLHSCLCFHLFSTPSLFNLEQLIPEEIVAIHVSKTQNLKLKPAVLNVLGKMLRYSQTHVIS